MNSDGVNAVSNVSTFFLLLPDYLGKTGNNSINPSQLLRELDYQSSEGPVESYIVPDRRHRALRRPAERDEVVGCYLTLLCSPEQAA
jgi:hypothetical protein